MIAGAVGVKGVIGCLGTVISRIVLMLFQSAVTEQAYSFRSNVDSCSSGILLGAF